MPTKKEVAKDLVRYHVLIEDGITDAFRYVRNGGDLEEEPVKLLEVSQATVPAGVMPIFFGPSLDYPYPIGLQPTDYSGD